MKKLFLLLTLAVFAMPMTAKAESPNPYTDCGIGAAIFQDEDLRVAAAVSNVIWDLGTTAITSAVSSPGTCTKNQAKTAALILETLPELEKDVAMGEGQYVVALAETMGCSSSEGVAKSMRSGYADIVANEAYGSQTSVERASAMYNVARDAANANSCVL